MSQFFLLAAQPNDLAFAPFSHVLTDPRRVESGPDAIVFGWSCTEANAEAKTSRLSSMADSEYGCTSEHESFWTTSLWLIITSHFEVST